jgi:hypothetical protein
MVLDWTPINKESNRILFQVAKPIQEADNGEMSQARATAEQSLRAFDEIHRAVAEGEYGRWKNWYRGDWLTNVHRTHELVHIFFKYPEDPLSPLPPPVFWDGWEAYYHIMRYEGDRSAEVK